MPVYATIYFCFLASLIGAVMGSFINCWALRYLTGERYPRGRSHCPKCGATLGARDLVPVFSYLFLRGRCRFCHEPISPRYMLVELLSAGAYLAAWLTFGFSLRTLELMCLMPALLLLALIDLDIMELPNGPMLYAAAVFLVFLPAYPEPFTRLWHGALTGAVIFAVLLALSLLMDKLTGRDTLGGGDLKLMAVLSLFLGPAGALLALITACVLGLLTMALLRARGRAFPFGPALCAAAVLTLLWGQPLIDLYLGLF